MAESLSAPAPAKINLSLEVLGLRDDGYHELRTVVQTIALADVVTVRFAVGGPRVVVTGPYACATPTAEDNLAWRAAAALAGRLGRTLDGLSIAIEKRIPPAGGLGGGASDAATVLRLLQRHWPGVMDEDIIAAANEVGSDEAALALGGTVLARGRGDIVTPLPPLPPHGVVLFLSESDGHGKTTRMFARLAGSSHDDGSRTEALVQRLPARLSSRDVYNRFDEAARTAFPGLDGLWHDIERRIGEPVHLAGAGPALFWIGHPSQAAAIAAKAAGCAATVVATAIAPSPWMP